MNTRPQQQPASGMGRLAGTAIIDLPIRAVGTSPIATWLQGVCWATLLAICAEIVCPAPDDIRTLASGTGFEDEDCLGRERDKCIDQERGVRLRLAYHQLIT
jgi:hypothetical protein